MGQTGKTIVGVVMVAIFASLLAGWVVLRQRLVDTESFYHLSVTPGGSVLVPTTDHLLHIPVYGEQRVLSLADLGLAGHFGRLAPTDDDQFFALLLPDSQTSILKRCSLAAQYCEKVADTEFFPKHAHRLYWLAEQELLLAVDNAGHRLVLLDTDGRRVDERKGFRYPNGVYVQDDRILLADTDNHRVLEIAVSRSGFGRQIAEHEIHRSTKYRWPAEVFPDDWGWLVQIAGDAMGDDAVAAYSSGWQEEPMVDPADGRDVVSSTFADGWLWLALDDRQLYRTRAPYTELQAFTPGAASRFLDELSGQFASRKLWLMVLQGTGLVLFGLGLFVAWRLDGSRFMDLQQKQQFSDMRQYPAESGKSPYVPAARVEIAKGASERQLWLLCGLIVSCALLLASLLPFLDGAGIFEIAIVAFSALLAGALVLILRHQRKLAMAVDSGGIEVTFGDHVFRSAPQDLLANGAWLVVEEKLVPLGGRDMRVFNTEDFSRHVMPLLSDIQPPGARRLFRLLAAAPNRDLLGACVLVAVAFILLGLTLLVVG